MVTPPRAILDGIEAHLGHGLIHKAIDIAHKRGAITRRDVVELEQEMGRSRRLPPS